MSNVIPLNAIAKHRQRMQDEACLWIVRMNEGLSDAELEELHAWLDANSDHVGMLLEVAQVWDQTSVIAELSRVFPLQEYRKPQRMRKSWKVATALAATLLLAVLGPLVASWLESAAPAATALTGQYTNSYETAVGQKTTIVLPDGSVVILNTNSSLAVSFSKEYREVTLQRGEGHFTVARDKARPFRVYTSSGMVEAVGTAFAVQESPQEGLKVTVVEGVVNFTPKNSEPAAAVPEAITAVAGEAIAASPISLVAGDVVEFNIADETIIKQQVEADEIDNRLAWRGGMLLFQGDPLEQVIKEVSRYTTVRIDVDEAIRDIKVLAYFRTGDVEAMLLTMRDTFGIKVERLSEDHIVLTSEN